MLFEGAEGRGLEVGLSKPTQRMTHPGLVGPCPWTSVSPSIQWGAWCSPGSNNHCSRSISGRGGTWSPATPVSGIEEQRPTHPLALSLIHPASQNALGWLAGPRSSCPVPLTSPQGPPAWPLTHPLRPDAQWFSKPPSPPPGWQQEEGRKRIVSSWPGRQISLCPSALQEPPFFLPPSPRPVHGDLGSARKVRQLVRDQSKGRWGLPTWLGFSPWERRRVPSPTPCALSVPSDFDPELQSSRGQDAPESGASLQEIGPWAHSSCLFAAEIWHARWLGAGVGGTKDLSVPPVSAEKVHVRARRRWQPCRDHR